MPNTYQQHANALKEINDRKEILAQHYRGEVIHAVKMYLQNLLTLDELSQHMGTLEKEQAAALDQLNQEINDLPDYTLSPISPMHRAWN